MALSDNGLALGKEIVKWATAALTVAGATLALWIQSHNQHADKQAIEVEKVKALQSIDAKLVGRPLVFGEKPE